MWQKSLRRRSDILSGIFGRDLWSSTYFYWCNFAGQKIHVVCTYFFWCNFDGRKIHVVCTYFFWCNFDGRKISVFSTYFSWSRYAYLFTYFFRRNFDGLKFDIVFGKLQANENIRKGFPLFVTLNSRLLQDFSL